MGSNSEIQGYNFYPMLHFRRKFSSSVTARKQETRAAQQERRKWCGPERQRYSKAAHSQENQKVQQKRGVVKGRSGEPSEC